MTRETTYEKRAEPRDGSAFVRPGERVDDLMRAGLRIIQRPGAFCFGSDSVLLADFAAVRPHDRVADLGTGTGILALLMCDSEPTARFEAIEIQPGMADMAARSVRMNGLETRISVRAMDMREAPAALGQGSCTLVVCNPPYGAPESGVACPDAGRGVARQQGEITIEEIARCGARLLKNRARMALVYPARELARLFDALRGARLEPKRIRLVQGRLDTPPKLALVEAVLNGGAQLHWLPTLILKEPDGRDTAEVRRIYHMA